MKSLDLTGRKYGRWTVIRKAESTDGRSWFFCQCECGTERNVRGQRLINGGSQSCGCGQKEAVKKCKQRHGESFTKLHSVWCAIKTRCYNSENPNYKRYGARGIRVCKEWMESYEEFAKFVGQPPTAQHSLERIDNNGNYEPGNVRWATKKEQARNRRTNRIVDINGERHCLAEWLEEKGLHKSTFEGRIRRGWNEQDAILEPAA